jgi:hypothetical protein
MLLSKSDALCLHSFALLYCIQLYCSTEGHVKVEIGIRAVNTEELEPANLVRNLLTWDARIPTSPLR